MLTGAYSFQQFSQSLYSLGWYESELNVERMVLLFMGTAVIREYSIWKKQFSELFLLSFKLSSKDIKIIEYAYKNKPDSKISECLNWYTQYIKLYKNILEKVENLFIG